MNEIKDSMAAGIHARDQVRPRHRTLRRYAGRQMAERALFGQAGEVWHLALGHELCEQVGVEAVDAQDDHFSGGKGPATGVLAGEQQAQPRGA